MICRKLANTVAETLIEKAEFDWLSAIEGNAFSMLSQVHQAEPEVGLEALSSGIQLYQRATDGDGETSTDAGVNQRRPDEISGYMDCSQRTERNVRGSGESPKNRQKGKQRYGR